MTESEFDEYWPLMSTVYTKIGGLLLQQNGELEVKNTSAIYVRVRKEESHHQ